LEVEAGEHVGACSDMLYYVCDMKDALLIEMEMWAVSASLKIVHKQLAFL